MPWTIRIHRYAQQDIERLRRAGRFRDERLVMGRIEDSLYSDPHLAGRATELPNVRALRAGRRFIIYKLKPWRQTVIVQRVVREDELPPPPRGHSPI